jgi:hypothetical protein
MQSRQPSVNIPSNILSQEPVRSGDIRTNCTIGALVWGCIEGLLVLVVGAILEHSEADLAYKCKYKHCRCGIMQAEICTPYGEEHITIMPQGTFIVKDDY